MFKKIIAFLVLFVAFYSPVSVLAVKYCDICCNSSVGSDCPANSICAGESTGCNVGTKVGVGQCQPSNETVVFCNLSKYGEIKDVVNLVTKWIFYLALVLAPLMILLGGFYMLTSRGDPKMSNTGKDIIKWAIIGLAVILLAKAFVSIITMVLKWDLFYMLFDHSGIFFRNVSSVASLVFIGFLAFILGTYVIIESKRIEKLQQPLPMYILNNKLNN